MDGDFFFVYLRGLKPRDCFVGTFFLMTNDSSTVAKIKRVMILIYLWIFKVFKKRQLKFVLETEKSVFDLIPFD